MNIPSLLGDLLLDGIVHWCDRWQWQGWSGGNCWPWDVGFASGYRWLSGGYEGLSGGYEGFSGGDQRLVLRWGHPRAGCLGCSCGDWRQFREDDLWSDWWASGGGPLLIQVWDVVVMIWRHFAWSQGVNNHFRDG